MSESSSHTSVQASNPTPAQMKELFKQVYRGDATKEVLEVFLGLPKKKPVSIEQACESMGKQHVVTMRQAGDFFEFYPPQEPLVPYDEYYLNVCDNDERWQAEHWRLVYLQGFSVLEMIWMLEDKQFPHKRFDLSICDPEMLDVRGRPCWSRIKPMPGYYLLRNVGIRNKNHKTRGNVVNWGQEEVVERCNEAMMLEMLLHVLATYPDSEYARPQIFLGPSCTNLNNTRVTIEVKPKVEGRHWLDLSWVHLENEIPKGVDVRVLEHFPSWRM